MIALTLMFILVMIAIRYYIGDQFKGKYRK